MMKLTKTILSRTLWLARGTVTMLGLAVMLAVVLGVGTTALAAVPGDPLKLGQFNDALSEGTGLTSSRSGPTLDLVNTNDGSITERVVAPALGLTVQPGQPPLTVNPQAGRATNLDADKLDGREAASFANGTGGKANDADRLDGKDSSAFYSGQTYGKSVQKNGPGGGKVVLFTGGFDGLDCDDGDVAIGGGGNANDINDDLNNVTPFPSSYQIEFQDNGNSGGLFKAQIICADFPPLH